MIRLLASFVMLASVACAQSPASSPSLLAKEATNHALSGAAVAPGAVSPTVEGRAPAVPDIPPLPEGKTTLLGGTIEKVDHMRDRLTLQVFGGRRTSVLFDERTRVFRDGKSTSPDDLKNGERAYVDTTLDGTDIFARNVRIATHGPTGQSSGQIVDFRPGSGELTLRDSISPEPVTMRLAAGAVILRGDHNAQPDELRPGTLVTLSFTPGDGAAPMVRQISILATPGASFVFAGRIEHLDLRRGLMVLVDPRDNKSYEVYFDPADRPLTQKLRQGANVTVQATFDGTRYHSRETAVNSVTNQ